MEAKAKIIEVWPQLGDSSSIPLKYASEEKIPPFKGIFQSKKSPKTVEKGTSLENFVRSIMELMGSNETFIKKTNKNNFPEEVLVDPIIHTEPIKEFVLLKIEKIEKGTPSSKRPECYIDNGDV